MHSRQIFRWLSENTDKFKVFAQVLPWGRTSWIIDKTLENGLIEKIMIASGFNPQNERFDLSFQVQLPNEWDENLASFNVGVSAVVETDRCNPVWIESCNKMDLVIVPSTFTKQVLLNTGKVTTPIIVVGESYFDSCDDEQESIFEFDTAFNFLILGQLTGNNAFNDRKNLYFTLKWLVETFKDDPEVGVVLKTNSGKGTKIDKALTRTTLKTIISEVRPGKYPKIHFLHGNMTPEEIASLYQTKSIKALVSATRGEGFGLPLLEASACQLPVIATNWSGHRDFLDLGKWIKIDYRLATIHESRVDNNIFIKDTQWAEPIESDFKEKIIKFRKKPHQPTKWAQELSKKIKKQYSFDAISKKYENIYTEWIEGNLKDNARLVF